MKKTELKKITQKFLENFCIALNKKIQEIAEKKGLSPELFFKKIPENAEKEEYHAIFKEATKFKKMGECAFLAFTIEDMNEAQEKQKEEKQKKQDNEDLLKTATFRSFFKKYQKNKEKTKILPEFLDKLKNIYEAGAGNNEQRQTIQAVLKFNKIID